MSETNNIDHAKGFRSTRLWKFVRGQVRKNKKLHSFVGWLLWKICSLYQAIKYYMWLHFKSHRYALIGLREYIADNNCEKTSLFNEESVLTQNPQVFPLEKAGSLTPPHCEYAFPNIYMATIHGGLVIGNSNLFIVNDLMVHHDLYDYQRDFTSEELHGRAFLWSAAKNIAWLSDINTERVINSAAIFTDACSVNYAHWMTEVLPRINIFCSNDNFADTPIIVNNNLHKNLIESLKVIAGDAREIIFIDEDVTILVENLYVVSVAGYVPFQRRTNRLKNHSHGKFSPIALSLLRDKIKNSDLYKPIGYSNKIFIRRNSHMRNIINEKEIESLLIDQGFVVIEPEKMTFAEQFAVFSAAEVIVGATGAAFANIIFCKPMTKIVIMISDYKHMPYWYWQNMACSVSNTVTYVIGRCGRFKHLHVDFIINGEDVLNAIK
jgi:capsular polysaccharide biosynthesis protein